MTRRADSPEDQDPSPRSRHADLEAAADGLARISHELKTPLVTIKGYAELLLDQREMPLTPGLRDWVRRIAAAANRLDGLVRRVTGESRADVQYSYQGTPTHPEEWLRRCVDDTRNLSTHRVLSWSWSVGERAPSAAVDPDQARDLLMELLQNAARATPDGGSVAVSAVAESRVGKPGLRVTVADTGVGFPRGEDVFGRFVVSGPLRMHHSGDFEYGAEGLGLGLSLVRRIARANGGEAWVEGRERDRESLPGGVIHVWLPAAAVEAARGEVADGRTETGGRLLVADEDEELREILSTALADAYDVEVAATEEEALAKWGAGGADWRAIVFDPEIAAAGSVAFVKALRAVPGTETAAVVSYAGTELTYAAEALRAAGVDACLWKPVRTRVILQRLSAIRARKRLP